MNRIIIKIMRKIRRKLIHLINVGKGEVVTNIPEITDLSVKKIDYTGKRINILVPSIRVEHVFGGISTALKFFDAITDMAGVEKRIILTDASPTSADIERFRGAKLVDMESDEISMFSITDCSDRYNRYLSVGENEIFIATGWWTAYNAINIIKWQSREYKKETNKLIYFIQDYEPGFYQWGSRFQLAESTYNAAVETIAIFNSSQLKTYFMNKGYTFLKYYCFEPKLNEVLKKKLKAITKYKKEKMILVYGRPSTARNSFSLIVESLKKWVILHDDVYDWEIISLGEKFDDIELGGGIKLKSYGKVSLEEYANMLQKAYLGVSLMVSPHPSYPPLEMASFGMKVITNKFENKDLTSFSRNIVNVKDIRLDTIAEQISELCSEYVSEKENKIGVKKTYLSEFEFEFVEDILKSV